MGISREGLQVFWTVPLFERKKPILQLRFRKLGGVALGVAHVLHRESLVFLMDPLFERKGVGHNC